MSGSWEGSFDQIQSVGSFGAHAGFVASADVVYVDEYLVAALPVPHLIPGVARVIEDGPNRGGLPKSESRMPMTISPGPTGPASVPCLDSQTRD